MTVHFKVDQLIVLKHVGIGCDARGSVAQSHHLPDVRQLQPMLLMPPNAFASSGLCCREVRVGILDAGADLQLCGLMTVVSLHSRWLLEKAEAALRSRRSPFSTPKGPKSLKKLATTLLKL